MRALLTVLILAMVTLGGCTKEADEKSAPPIEVPTGNTISGVVVTPTIQPIPGAKIILNPGGLEDTADLFGRFRFDDLEAGQYSLKVTNEGYDDTTKAVIVSDTEIARPKIILNAIQPPVERHTTVQFQGFMKSNFGAADETLEPHKENLGMQGCDCKFYFSVPRYTAAITVEMTWGDSVAPPEGAPQPAYRWTVAPLSLSHQAQGSGPNPIVTLLTPESFEGGEEIDFSTIGSMSFEFRGDEYVPTTDQFVDIFITIWEVNGPADEDWSFVNGDR